MHNRITLKHQFSDNITPGLQQDLLDDTIKRIENYETSYFKSVLNKQDAEIYVSVNISKNVEGLYIGKFLFTLDSQDIPYHNDTPFSEPLDIVGHAFKRLKEVMSNAK